jgi:hypothetical protein
VQVFNTFNHTHDFKHMALKFQGPLNFRAIKGLVLYSHHSHVFPVLPLLRLC